MKVAEDSRTMIDVNMGTGLHNKNKNRARNNCPPIVWCLEWSTLDADGIGHGVSPPFPKLSFVVGKER